MTGAEAPGEGVRTLSVLFTDLVGSTELFARVGEEDAEKLRGRHFSILRRAVGGHGGREVKGLGDGLLAVFESASDAVACAVGMQRAIADECNRRGAEPMAIRIGLSSGDVAVEGGDCFGEAVTEASRLCAAAGPGQILAANLLPSLLRGRGRYAFHSVGALELKGLPAPVEACEVAWEPASWRTIRVVLADDAVLVREGVARLLEENGVSVVVRPATARSS